MYLFRYLNLRKPRLPPVRCHIRASQFLTVLGLVWGSVPPFSLVFLLSDRLLATTMQSYHYIRIHVLLVFGDFFCYMGYGGQLGDIEIYYMYLGI